MAFARGSGRYLGSAAVLALGVWAAFAVTRHPGFLGVAVPAALMLLFFLWFFRDPERSIGPDVVSPADGRVLFTETVGPQTRLAIFMTPWSVHVNRAPLAGRLKALEYHRGAHVPAFDKESERNERVEMDFDTAQGPLRVRLIAGTVARRIHPYLLPGVEVKKGDRLGLIAFGSRCELLLPTERFRVTVGRGQWVRAGVTPVAQEVA